MEFIKTKIDEHVAWLTIDRESKLNALNKQVIDELETAFKVLTGNDEVEVIVIKGAGEKSFVAGADIAEFPTLSPDSAYNLSKRGQEVFNQIETSDKPVIAAVNGFALGGGCELALACHIRLAAAHAQFGQPEVKLGVIAGYGGTQRLSRLVGQGNALDLLLSGRMLRADEALRMGLVSQVFDSDAFDESVAAYAAEVRKQGSLGQKFTLRAVYGGTEQSLEAGLETEAQAFKAVFDSDDRVEGTKAFLERRAPDFKNS